jgi:hypothetical protein
MIISIIIKSINSIRTLFDNLIYYLTHYTASKNDIRILELEGVIKNYIANSENNMKKCLDNQLYILSELKKITRYKELRNDVW